MITNPTTPSNHTHPFTHSPTHGLFVPTRHIGKAKVIPAPIDVEMLKYQADYAYDKSRLKLWLKSRQIGGSTTSGKALVDRISADNAKIDAFISSSNETQARLYMEACFAYAQRIHIPAENEGKTIIDEEGNTAYVLRFANGRRIFSMSSSVNAQAGKTGDRIIDEFATIPHARELYGVAFPGTMWRGSKLEIISTQRGRDTYFNELVEEIVHGGNPKKFSFHKTTFEDALKQGLLYKLQIHAPEDDMIQQMDEADFFNYQRANCPDEQYFLQEYMCVASDLRSAFLPHDMIVNCEYAPGEKWELTEEIIAKSQNTFFAGMDIAREKDLSVIWLVEKVGDVYHTRVVQVMEKESFDAQEAALETLMKWNRVRRVCIDNTGIGRQFVERAQRRYGEFRIEAVTFTAEVKEDIGYRLRTAFEKRRIRIPNDNAIRADLRSVRKEIMPTGAIRLTSGRSENGHADRFWALGMAVWGAETYPGEPGAYVA